MKKKFWTVLIITFSSSAFAGNSCEQFCSSLKARIPSFSKGEYNVFKSALQADPYINSGDWGVAEYMGGYYRQHGYPNLSDIPVKQLLHTCFLQEIDTISGNLRAVKAVMTPALQVSEGLVRNCSH